ncbi:WXG100 family type VII secretion target [Amycolatopsis sp. lyj-23]|uniref:WXG100 family type VII secretion target n=1 Tax=Amycolatopsis sp. lyj-23 TaxID=2789283 RepID=UPI00397CFFC7
MSPPESLPPVLDPELQALTFDQLAQLVDEVNPEVFYERARAFEAAVVRFEQVRSDLDRQTRHLWEAWSGQGAESFEVFARQLSSRVDAVVQAMADPGHGAVLRRVGDALAQAQQRMHDLRAQNRQSDAESARQVVYDLGTAYQDLGTILTSVPEAPSAPRAVVDERSAPSVGEADANSSPQRERSDDSETFSAGQDNSRAGGFTPGGAFAFLGILAPTPPAEATSPTETSCATSPVLGRAPAETASIDAEPQQRDTAVVLGRPVPVMRPGIRSVRAKRDERATDDPGATAAAAGWDEPAAGTQEVLTTSAPHSHEKVTAAEPPGATSTTKPATVPTVTAPAAQTAPAVPATAHAVPGARTAQSITVAAPPGPISPHTAPVLPAVGTPATAHPAPAPGQVPMLSGEPLPSPAHEAMPSTARPPGALPPSPAFHPVTGNLDAATAGAPPVGPQVPGAPRGGGDPSVGGGFLGSGFRDGTGAEEHAGTRDPAGYLEAEPGAWSHSGDGAPVLGRRSTSPPADEEVPAGGEDLTRIQDPEELRRVLERLGRPNSE